MAEGSIESIDPRVAARELARIAQAKQAGPAGKIEAPRAEPPAPLPAAGPAAVDGVEPGAKVVSARLAAANAPASSAPTPTAPTSAAPANPPHSPSIAEAIGQVEARRVAEILRAADIPVPDQLKALEARAAGKAEAPAPRADAPQAKLAAPPAPTQTRTAPEVSAADVERIAKSLRRALGRGSEAGTNRARNPINQLTVRQTRRLAAALLAETPNEAPRPARAPQSPPPKAIANPPQSRPEADAAQARVMKLLQAIGQVAAEAPAGETALARLGRLVQKLEAEQSAPRPEASAKQLSANEKPAPPPSDAKLAAGGQSDRRAPAGPATKDVPPFARAEGPAAPKTSRAPSFGSEPKVQSSPSPKASPSPTSDQRVARAAAPTPEQATVAQSPSKAETAPAPEGEQPVRREQGGSQRQDNDNPKREPDTPPRQKTEPATAEAKPKATQTVPRVKTPDQNAEPHRTAEPPSQAERAKPPRNSSTTSRTDSGAQAKPANDPSGRTPAESARPRDADQQVRSAADRPNAEPREPANARERTAETKPAQPRSEEPRPEPKQPARPRTEPARTPETNKSAPRAEARPEPAPKPLPKPAASFLARLKSAGGVKATPIVPSPSAVAPAALARAIPLPAGQPLPLTAPLTAGGAPLLGTAIPPAAGGAVIASPLGIPGKGGAEPGAKAKGQPSGANLPGSPPNAGAGANVGRVGQASTQARAPGLPSQSGQSPAQTPARGGASGGSGEQVPTAKPGSPATPSALSQPGAPSNGGLARGANTAKSPTVSIAPFGPALSPGASNIPVRPNGALLTRTILARGMLAEVPRVDIGRLEGVLRGLYERGIAPERVQVKQTASGSLEVAVEGDDPKLERPVEASVDDKGDLRLRGLGRIEQANPAPIKPEQALQPVQADEAIEANRDDGEDRPGRGHERGGEREAGRKGAQEHAPSERAPRDEGEADLYDNPYLGSGMVMPQAGFEQLAVADRPSTALIQLRLEYHAPEIVRP